MARFSYTDALGVGVDMRGWEAFAGDPRTAEATRIVFRDGEARISYSGDFDWSGGAPRGVVEAARLRVGGEDVLIVDGLGLDAGRFWRFVENDDPQGARDFLLSRGDTILGTGYGDRLIGGAGGDRIEGRDGADRIWGGAGKDKLFGGDGRDRLWGEAGADRLEGGRGADRLYGGEGEDRLFGGAGDDRLFGGEGGDRLVGGAGDDVLTGGGGRDLLYGGAGADVFVFASRFDFATPDAPDLIADFSQAEGDRIDLSAIDANTLQAGMQEFVFIGRKAFSGAPGELRFKDGELSGDVQGDRAADFFVSVAGVDRMRADDFIL